MFDPAELELYEFKKEISEMRIGIDYPSWNLSKMDKFKIFLTELFNNFPIKCKISFREAIHKNNGDKILEISVKTKDYGNLSTILDYDLIKSKKCPPNLPNKIFEEFSKKFEMKINSTEKRILGKIKNKGEN